MEKTRREVLKDGAAVSVALFAAGSLPGGVAVAVEPGKGFLTAAELGKLRGAVDVFVPADQDPGAVQARCAEAIDGLLAAFKTKPPRIYAGAPFSDRGGATRNGFKRFLPLDAYEERAWRVRIRGSKRVKGLQAVYRDGLAALPDDFAGRSAGERDQLLGGGGAVGEMVDVAWPHTWQFIYGAPEYGGNEGLVGWKYTGWDGDVQPRGWTTAQVEAPPDPASAVALAGDVLPFAASAESMSVLLSGNAGSSQRALEEALQRGR